MNPGDTHCTSAHYLRHLIAFYLVFFVMVMTPLESISQESFSDSLAQSIPPVTIDSLQTRVIVDTLQRDTTSVISDTLALPIKKTTSIGMDTTLTYDAKVINIYVPERITYLIGNAVVKYKTITLHAGKITVDWNTNILTAEGIPDTVHSAEENPGDSSLTINWRDLPTLSDQGDVMQGFQMIYNFKTEKARVIRGRTEFEGGYYFGKTMKKVKEDVINISHGQFTTCDLKDDPHFHFESRRIKVIFKDKVIAKPVVFYLGNIPLAIIPFAVFPNKSGRHSGVIIPSYGQSRDEGRFIRGLGYYWAPNDYFDSRLLVDFYDRSGWLFRGDTQYALRYVLNGHISGSFTRKNFISGQSQKRWDLLISHNQTVDPTMNLRVDGRFVSDNSFYRDYSSNLSERLNREIRSNATFSKNWPEQRFSLSANLSQSRDIETGRISQTLPQLRFTVSQRRIFSIDESRQLKLKQEKEDLKWYHSIYYNYSNNLYNQETTGGGAQRTFSRYIDHSVGINMNTPQKIFGWLTMGQSFSYQERWYDRYKKNRFIPETNSVEVDTVSGFAARRTFSYGLSSSTNIYGMFATNIGTVKAIRHVVTPSISFNYSPDFSHPRWGYVDTYMDTVGKELTYQRFLDGVPRGGQKSMSFSIRNLFQMKTVAGEKEKKFDLFTITSSSNYNFEADKFKLSSLSSSFNSTVFQNLNINMSTTHDFYKYDSETKQRINKLLILEDKDWWKRRPFRLTYFRFSASIRFQSARSGQKRTDESSDEGIIRTAEGDLVSLEEYYDQLYRAGGTRFEPETRFSGLAIPWRATFSLDFNLNKFNPDNPSKSYYLNISGVEIQLTQNWKIYYSARYDVEKKELINHSFTFYRNLHCWEARFEWRPSGIGAPFFYFRINVKSTQLRDLKWEKRGGRSSVLRYY